MSPTHNTNKPLLLATVRPALEHLAKEREQVKSRAMHIYVFSLVASAMLYFYLKRYGITSTRVGWQILCAPLGAAFFASRKIINSFKQKYKVQIFDAAIRHSFPTLAYSPSSHIGLLDFNESGLAPESIDEFTGEDYFTGHFDGVPIAFSEITALKVERRNRKEIVFKGILYMAEFNKNLYATTIVKPRGLNSALSGAVASAVNTVLATTGSPVMRESVLLENTEFEKHFYTSSTDQVEARYVLTPGLMERICAIKSRQKYHHLSFSFTGSKMYMAINDHEDRFEPKIFGKVSDVESVLEFVQEVKTFYEIISLLKLNEYLWSKAKIPVLDLGYAYVDPKNYPKDA